MHLVRRAQRGDPQAFQRLWDRYAALAHGILLTMVHSEDADDLMQDVAVAALGGLRDLRQPESFPAWLGTIARNLGRDALAAAPRRREQGVGDPAALLGVAAPPVGNPGEAEEILAEIRALPECYREPLILRLMLEMSGPEIAEHIGMTCGSVRVNLCRGMKLLRDRLERQA